MNKSAILFVVAMASIACGCRSRHPDNAKSGGSGEVKSGGEIRLVDCFVLSNESNASSDVFCEVVFHFSNQSDFPVRVTGEILEIDAEDIVIDRVDAVSDLSESCAIVLPDEGDIEIPKDFALSITLDLPSFSNMDFHPPGRYRVYHKKFPSCFAYFEKTKLGLVETIIFPEEENRQHRWGHSFNIKIF